jgi:hypothetical protein
MPGELVHPDDRPDPGERFRADLAGYLRDLSGGELADLLGGLPDPVKVDLIAELASAARPGCSCRPPGRATPTRNSPGAGRCGRWSPTCVPLEERARTRPPGMPPAADPARERRLGEALRGRAAQRAERDEPAAMAWEDLGRPREPEPPAQGWQDCWLRDEER